MAEDTKKPQPAATTARPANPARAEGQTRAAGQDAEAAKKQFIESRKAAAAAADPEEAAKAKEEANEVLAKAASETRPQEKSLKEMTPSEISKMAQVRTVADPTEVGNEFVQKIQDDTPAVEEGPKDRAPTAEESDLVEVTTNDRDMQIAAALAGKPIEATTQSAPSGARRKFVVRGANIHTADGKKKPGDVVELTSKEAKRFNDLGFLAPYLGEDE